MTYQPKTLKGALARIAKLEGLLSDAEASVLYYLRVANKALEAAEEQRLRRLAIEEETNLAFDKNVADARARHQEQ